MPRSRPAVLSWPTANLPRAATTSATWLLTVVLSHCTTSQSKVPAARQVRADRFKKSKQMIAAKLSRPPRPGVILRRRPKMAWAGERGAVRLEQRSITSRYGPHPRGQRTDSAWTFEKGPPPGHPCAARRNRARQATLMNVPCTAPDPAPLRGEILAERQAGQLRSPKETRSRARPRHGAPTLHAGCPVFTVRRRTSTPGRERIRRPAPCRTASAPAGCPPASVPRPDCCFEPASMPRQGSRELSDTYGLRWTPGTPTLEEPARPACSIGSRSKGRSFRPGERASILTSRLGAPLWQTEELFAIMRQLKGRTGPVASISSSTSSKEVQQIADVVTVSGAARSSGQRRPRRRTRNCRVMVAGRSPCNSARPRHAGQVGLDVSHLRVVTSAGLTRVERGCRSRSGPARSSHRGSAGPTGNRACAGAEWPPAPPPSGSGPA